MAAIPFFPTTTTALDQTSSTEALIQQVQLYASLLRNIIWTEETELLDRAVKTLAELPGSEDFVETDPRSFFAVLFLVSYTNWPPSLILNQRQQLCNQLDRRIGLETEIIICTRPVHTGAAPVAHPVVQHAEDFSFVKHPNPATAKLKITGPLGLDSSL
jgi:hypothetical protein